MPEDKIWKYTPQDFHNLLSRAVSPSVSSEVKERHQQAVLDEVCSTFNVGKKRAVFDYLYLSKEVSEFCSFDHIFGVRTPCRHCILFACFCFYFRSKFALLFWPSPIISRRSLLQEWQLGAPSMWKRRTFAINAKGCMKSNVSMLYRP